MFFSHGEGANLCYANYMELKMDTLTENVVAYIADRYFSLTNKFIAQILMYKILALVDFRSVSEVGIPCTSLEYWADKRGPVPHALKRCDDSALLEKRPVSINGHDAQVFSCKNRSGIDMAYFSQHDKKLIDETIQRAVSEKWDAVTASEISHKEIPAWKIAYDRPYPHKMSYSDGFSASTTEAKNVFPKYLKSKPDGRLVRNIKKLNKIASLETGWNGDDANSFSDSFLNRVRAILLSIENQPEIFPTAADSIQMEFDGKKNSYLEIQIRDSDTAEVYEVSRNGEEYSYEIVASEQTVSQTVRRFFHG